MINKLPEIGEKYNHKPKKFLYDPCEVHLIIIEKSGTWIQLIDSAGNWPERISTEIFQKSFEEVTEKVNLIDEVKILKEILRYDIRMKEGFFYDGRVQTNLFNSLMKSLENFLDALDEQEKIVCSPEKEASKSIWKKANEFSISDYSTNLVRIGGKIMIMQHNFIKDQFITIDNIKIDPNDPNIDNCASFSDFINSFEELQERVNKLENKNIK